MVAIARKEICFNWSPGVDGIDITARKGSEQTPIMRLIPESEFYNKGLQIHHKNLVDMEEVAQSICNLLDNFALSDVLDAQRYDFLIASCHHYIVKSKPYSELESLVERDMW